MMKSSYIVLVGLVLLCAVLVGVRAGRTEGLQAKVASLEKVRTLFPPATIEVPKDIPFCILQQGDGMVKLLPYTEEQLLRDLKAGRQMPVLKGQTAFMPILGPSAYTQGYYDGWQYRIAEVTGLFEEEKEKPWNVVKTGTPFIAIYDRGMKEGYEDCQRRVVVLRKAMPAADFKRMADACYFPSVGFPANQSPPKLD